MSSKPIRAVLVATLLLAANASVSKGADQATEDWIRGSARDLQICLKGEVFESDGEAATDVRISCGVNGSDPTQRLEPTVDGHHFAVWIPVNAANWNSLWLKASSTHNDDVSYKTLTAYELRQAAIDGVKLTLRPPTRQIRVRVMDEGQPVIGAKVKAELEFGIESRSQTDGSGTARFDLLPEQELSHLTAWTDDYRIGGFSFDRTPTRDPNDVEQVVELSKCHDQKLRFVDEDGSPVRGAEFIIQMATAAPNYNFIGTNEHSRMQTDAAGEVVYRWFPDWDKPYFYADLITSGWVINGDPETDADAIVFKLKKSKERKRVSGRVISASTDVGGFYVSMRSFQGERKMYSELVSAFTNSDGSFTVDVLPDARYCAYVLDALWVGEIIDLIPYQLAFDQINPPELSVSAGQKVEVLATSGPQKKPYPNLSISFRREHAYTWQENGRTQNGIGGPQWYVTTDEFGRATTHTLPGKLKASVYTPKWRTEETVNVGSDEAAKVALHRENDEKRTVKGRLVLAEGIEANLNDVEIHVGTVDGKYDDQQTLKCTEDGTFSFDILGTEIGIFGSTQDGQVAGSIVVKDLNAPIELRLRPTLTYDGQLLGEGDQPLVDHGIQAIARVEGDNQHNALSPTGMYAKRIETRTDEQGNYTLHGIPSDMKVTIYAAAIDGSKGYAFLRDIFLEPNESRPRTISRLAKSAKSISDVPLTERFRTTLRDCALCGFRLMLIISDGSAPVAEFVNDNFVDYQRNHEVGGFMQVSVTAAQDRLNSADVAFLRERNWQLPDMDHVIAYAIDANGKELKKLEIDAKDRKAVEAAAEFIHRYAPPQVNAEEKWAAAFADAKRSNRRVWARVSGRYCGPCFALARWLDDQHELLEKDYVMLKIDDVRDQNGAHVAERVALGKQDGIPFFAIFDQNGDLLIDSAGPLGNIGCPSGAEGKQHLRKMLFETRRNLTDAEIEQLVESVGD